MRAQSVFGAERPQVPAPDHKNKEGASSYSRGLYEETLEALMTGTFGNTFYVSARDVADSAVELFTRMASEDPEFLAKAAVYARERGFMRLAPIVALVALSHAEGPWFHLAFGRVVRNADDLRSLVAVADGNRLGRTYGGRVQRAVGKWLDAHLDEYQAIKYLGSGERYGLRNILRMTHPKPSTEERAAVFRWVVKGEADGEKAPRIYALEHIAEIDQAMAIEQFGLPFEAVTPRVKMDPQTWQALARVAPYLNMIRSINAFYRAGALDDEVTTNLLVWKITNPSVIRKAKVWPFQIWQAVQALEPGVPVAIREALVQALEISVSNLPDLSHYRIVVAPDISSSMNAALGKHATAATVAGIFSAAVFKASKGSARVLAFHNLVREMKWSVQDTALTMASTISSAIGGGTNLSAPIVQLTKEHNAVDLFVGLTDSEDWAGERYYETTFLQTWRHYKQAVAPKAKAVLVQLMPYRDAVAPKSEPDVHYVYGWSPDILRYVAYVLEGGLSQTEAVRGIKL